MNAYSILLTPRSTTKCVSRHIAKCSREEILPRLIITALTTNLPDTSYIKRTYKYPLIFDIYPLLLNVTFYLYLKYVFLLFSCNFLHNLQIFKMRFKKKLWIKNFSHTWLLSNQHYKNEVIRMKG